MTPSIEMPRVDTYTLDEGTLSLSYPGRMSAESLDLFEEWLMLALRKIKRINSAAADPTPCPQCHEAGEHKVGCELS